MCLGTVSGFSGLDPKVFSFAYSPLFEGLSF